MQTPLILNSTNALPHNKPSVKQENDAAPATQFNQVLSRQINDHPNGTENKQPAHGKDNAATPKPAAANASKSTSKSAGDKEKAKDAADDSEEKAESLPAGPTELMALVAQVAQFEQANAKTTNSETSSSDKADAVVGVDVAKNSAKQLGTTETFKQLDADLAAEANSKNDGAINNAKQNDWLSATAQEVLPELSAAGKKQEILSELPASAKAPEVLQNLATASPHQIQLDALQSAGAGRPTEKLSPHVGTPAWDQALGQKIVWMVGGAQQSASLTLNPPDLGPLQVVLNVSNEQATATFISAQPEVRQAIEAALPKLREMMGEAGIQLGQTNINAGSGNQQESSSGQNRSSPSSFGHENVSADAPLSTANPAGLMTRQGLVNTFA